MPVVNRTEPNNGITWFTLAKSWTNTPKYREIVAKGGLLPENNFSWSQLQARGRNPYMRMDDGRLFTPLNLYNTFVEIRQKLESNGYLRIPSNPAAGDRWETTLMTRARLEALAGNKLSKKLNNRDIDLGVALGEARETAHFVQGAMLSAFTAAKRARRGDLSGVLKALGLSSNTDPKLQRFRDVPDRIAGAWLGFSYGVRPLMADVLGACQALEKRHQQPLLITHRSSSREDINVYLERTVGQKTAWAQMQDPDYVYKHVGWHKASDKLTFRVDNPFLYSLSSLGLTNPLSTAYELITLSFVVDWFLPIGDWLAGLVPPQGVTSVQRSITWRGYVETQIEYTACAYGPWAVFRYRPPQKSQGEAQERWKHRVKSTSFPRYHLVGASFDLSKQQIMSGLSLLWTFGASEKSQAKAFKDAVDLNSRGYSSNAGSLSREAWGAGNRKGLNKPKYVFPTEYARI